MKATCLLFLMIGSAALRIGIVYADPASPASQEQAPQSASKTVSNDRHDGEQAAPSDGGKDQRDGKYPEEHGDRQHVFDKDHPHGRGSLTKANRPVHLPNNRERFASGNTMNLLQPGSGRSEGAAKEGLMQSGAAHNTLRNRPQSDVRPSAPLVTNVRHRGPNPATINGTANSDRRNTATINGTRMNRKP